MVFAAFHRSIVVLFAFLAAAMIFAIPASGQRRRSAKKPAVARVETPKAAASPRKCTIESELTEAEREAILADHNKARKALKLPELKWDCGLASYAQEWANGGKFRHRDDPSVGENLFVANNADQPISTVVPDWLDEKPNYVVKTGDCVPDTVCTHYSQIMWRETTLIGCGINRHLSGKWVVFVVCNYSPAGNTGGPAY